MTSNLDALPLPPGDRSFPLIGETLAFLRDPFGFVTTRVERHGPVFRTHLLGHTTVVLAGHSVAAAFLDEASVQREGSMPPHVRELFGGSSLPLLDGEVHHTRKSHVMAAFSREAIAAYLRPMQELSEAAIERWIGAGEVKTLPELKRLVVTVMARAMLGVGEGADLEAIMSGIEAVSAGFGGVPIPLPGTAYKRGLDGRDTIRAILLRLIAEHRTLAHDDGLGRILAHRAPDGETIADEDVAREIHHVFLAGYIVFAELSAILERLAALPELADRLAQEITEACPSGAITPSALARLSLLRRVVLEVKRVTPVVPVTFAKAKTAFEVGGYRVPEGTPVYWAPFAHDQDATTFPDPSAFDPGRFEQGRAEHERFPNGYAPQGMGRVEGHLCAGVEYATVLMETFAIVALRRCRWSLPEQDMDLDRMKLPPEHVSGLRVAFHAAGSAPITRAHAAEKPSAHGKHVCHVEGLPQLPEHALLALASIVWADGVFTAEEASALVRIAQASGLDEAGVARVAHATRERHVIAHPSDGPLTMEPHLAEHLYSLACLVAAADGTVDAKEREAVRALGDRLGLDEGARGRAAVASHAVAEAFGASGKVLIAIASELDQP